MADAEIKVTSTIEVKITCSLDNSKMLAAIDELFSTGPADETSLGVVAEQLFVVEVHPDTTKANHMIIVCKPSDLFLEIIAKRKAAA